MVVASCFSPPVSLCSTPSSRRFSRSWSHPRWLKPRRREIHQLRITHITDNFLQSLIWNVDERDNGQHILMMRESLVNVSGTTAMVQFKHELRITMDGTSCTAPNQLCSAGFATLANISGFQGTLYAQSPMLSCPFLLYVSLIYPCSQCFTSSTPTRKYVIGLQD